MCGKGLVSNTTMISSQKVWRGHSFLICPQKYSCGHRLQKQYIEFKVLEMKQLSYDLLKCISRHNWPFLAKIKKNLLQSTLSYWDIHVFHLWVWPCLEMTFYQRLQGSFTCHCRSNDTGTAIIVIIRVTMYHARQACYPLDHQGGILCKKNTSG